MVASAGDAVAGKLTLRGGFGEVWGGLGRIKQDPEDWKDWEDCGVLGGLAGLGRILEELGEVFRISSGKSLYYVDVFEVYFL